LPHVVIDSPSYRELGHPARALLIDIARQYTGSNNGRLVACAKYLRPLGWRSNDTITRALVQLKGAQLLIETRLGMKPNRAAWFALGWYSLDNVSGMDIPDGHVKLLHVWPVKLLQAGRADYDASGLMAMRAAASFSL